MNEQYHYVQQMDIRYGHLELIDVPEIVANCKEKWFNQSLTRINDSVARIGIVQGEYHWHKHDQDDEFFFVLEGKLFIDYLKPLKRKLLKSKLDDITKGKISVDYKMSFPR